jgi:MYXO-CTERM domain-containing protein
MLAPAAARNKDARARRLNRVWRVHVRRFATCPLLPLAIAALLAGCDAPTPLNLGVDTRSIVGGTSTPASMLPAVGALVLEYGGFKQSFCSATVISDRLLVTAAHCVAAWVQLKAQEPSLELGFFNGPVVTPASTTLAVASAIPHPKYIDGGTPPNSLTEYDDVGVCRLAQATAIPPMKVIRPSEVANIKTGASVLIAGYGLTDPYKQTSGGDKNHGTTVIGSVAAPEIRILGDSRPQKCNGDSGGPTILEVEGASGTEQRLIGVASRAGENCVGGSVEERVDFYLSWIESFGTLPCGSGSSPDCAPPPPLKGFGETCASSNECTDKLCVEDSDGNKICSKPCVVDKDGCPTGTECQAASGSTQGACLKPPPPPPKKMPGQACAENTECESKVCLPKTGGGSACATGCDPSTSACATNQECVAWSTGDHYCATISIPTPTQPQSSSGCAVTGRPAPLGPAAFLLVALLALFLRRRA